MSMIFVGLTTLGVTYLLGTFLMAAFDITTWHPAQRFVVLIVGCIGAGIAMAETLNFLTKREK